MIDKLPYFIPGDWENTPMHSHAINPVIERINKLHELLRTIKGRGNIRVFTSQGNIIISDIPTDPNEGGPNMLGGNNTVVSGSGGGDTINNYNCVCRWA